MINLGRFSFGVFFSKTADYITYERRIGLRVSWSERQFWDIFIYPRPHIYKCKW